MSKLSYKKWNKPTQEELNLVLTKISLKHNLEPFQEKHTHRHKSDILVFLAKAFNATVYTAKNYTRFPEKMKLPVWIILNALAGNDLSDYVQYHGNYIETQRDFLIKTLGDNAFKGADEFRIKKEAMLILFKSDYSENLANFRVKGKLILPLSNQTRRDFSDSLSINYTVFCRNLQQNNFRYIHAKIYLLTLGFKVEEIGLV